MSDQTATLRPRADIPIRLQAGEAGDTRPEPDELDQISASFRVEADRTPALQMSRRDEAYRELGETLVELGADPEVVRGRRIGSDHGGIFQLREDDPHAEIWRLAKERGVEGLPETREEFERAAFRRYEGRSRDQDILARGQGIDSTLGQFAGAMGGAMVDPINLGTLPVGGFGRTLALRVLSEAGLNMAIESVQAFGVNPRAYERMGEDYTTRDGVVDVLTAGAGAAALRGGIELAPGAARATARGARRALAPVQQRFDQFFDERRFARALAKEGIPDSFTPQQRAAAEILLREAELDEASPFVRTIGGDDLHRTRMEEAAAAVERGQVPPAEPRPAPQGLRVSGARGEVAGALRNAGMNDTVIAGFLGNFEVEGGYRGARGDGGSASGIAQWRLARRARFRELFGKDPHEAAIGEQAEFVAWEMANPEAAGMTSAQRDAILAARTPEEAAELIDRYYERSDGQHRDRRRSAARGFYEGSGEPLPPRIDSEGGADLLAIETEQTAIELARVRNEQLAAELPGIVRPLLADRSVPINNPAALAGELGVDPAQLRRALTDMASNGELELVLPRGERGRVRSTGGRWRWQTNEEVMAANDGIWPGKFRRPRTSGPDDALAFIARAGGLSYDGLSPRGRVAMQKLKGEGAKIGHDLRNTGALDHFVPGAGPILRPNGRGLDDVGEDLWEAGYFGPPEATPRPTEAELIDWLDNGIRRGEKIYQPGEAPTAEPRVRKGRFQSDEHEHFERTRWGDAAQRLLGRDLSDDELFAAMDIGSAPEWRVVDRFDEDEALDIALVELVNRQADEALEDAFLEIEDDYYAGLAEDFADAADSEGRAPGARGEGQAADSADAGESGAGGERRAGDPETDELGSGRTDEAQRDALEDDRTRPPPDAEALNDFADAAGDGVQRAAQSDWHDIEAAQRPEPDTDPNIAARTAQETQLRADAPLRGENATGEAQDGTMGLELFDAADQPDFDLGDGKGARSVSEIRDEIVGDRSAIAAIRNCMI